MGLQAQISVNYNTGYEKICLSCRFPELSAAKHQYPTRHRQRRQNRQRNRGKPDTRSSGAQREPLICTMPPCPHLNALPSPFFGSSHLLDYTTANEAPLSISTTAGQKNKQTPMQGST
jgi:hypothetical protein